MIYDLGERDKNLNVDKYFLVYSTLIHVDGGLVHLLLPSLFDLVATGGWMRARMMGRSSGN